MLHSFRYLPLVIAVFASSMTPSQARAEEASDIDDETRGAARAVGTEGVLAFQAGDYSTAHERLERAFRLLPVPSLGLWSARALEKTGLWVQAAERYLKTTRLPLETGGDAAVQARAKEEAKAERSALLPRIPSVVIQVEALNGRQVQLSVNQVDIDSAFIGTPRPANPGPTEVKGQIEGGEIVRSVSLEAGERKIIILDFSKVAPVVTPAAPRIVTKKQSAPRSPKHSHSENAHISRTPLNWQIPAGWAGVGVGAAGLLTAGGFALSALSLDGKLECAEDNICPVDESDPTFKKYETHRRVAGIAFWAGGIVAAAGVTLLFLAPKNTTSAYIAPFIGPNSTGVQGVF